MQRWFTSFVAAFGLTLCALAGPALAQTYNGDTTGQPTWNRPIEGSTFAGLSGGATAVSYQLQRIQVATTGLYTLTAAYPTFDGFLFVYQTDFNPQSQSTNYIFGDDDFVIAPGAPAAGGSQIVTTLNGGTEYLVVATAFDNGDAGAYSVTITGPASVTLIGPPGAAAPTPTVTTITPNSGLNTGGNAVTIQGTGFFGVTSVTIGGNPATGVTVRSDTRITATAPAGTAGARDVVVTAAGGTGTGTGLYTYIAPVQPVVTAVSPNVGLLAGGDPVAISGTGFLGATAVTFGGTAAGTFTVASDTLINATIPARTAGTVDIAVTGPGGTGTGTGLFTYVAAQTTTYSGNTTGKPTWLRPNVNITTGAFTGVSGTTVAFEAQQITVATAGRYIFDATYGYDGFLVIYQTSFDPIAQGTNFVIGDDDGPGGAQTSQATATLAAGTHFVVATGFFASGVGAYSMTISGVAPVTLVGAPGGAANPPDITSVAPTSGLTTGGDLVTITGTGFTGTTAVSFGATAATFTVNGDTSITAATPTVGAAGAVDIVVTNPAGSDALVGGFTYIAAVTTSYSGDTTGKPTWDRPDVNVSGGFDGLSGETPAFEVQEIAVASTAVYSVTATWATHDGFLCLYEGSFSATAQSTGFVVGDDDFSGLGDSRVVATLTAGTPYFIVATGFFTGDEGPYDMDIVGPAAVTLVGPPGGAATPTPTVTAVNPNQGSAIGGTAVVITGTGFTGATAVTFDGAAAAFSVTSDTAIAATAPAGAVGPADIAVTTPGGTGTGVGLYTYVAAPTTLLTTYRGDTTGLATWTRADATGAVSTSTGVPFQVQEIAVTTTGTYTITAAWDVHDGFLFLYQIAFSPTAQTVNFVAGDDDFSIGGASQFLGSQLSATLTAGTPYFIVATGFDSVEEGPYTMEVSGPDFVTLVGVGPGGALQVTAVQPAEGTAAGGTQITIIGAGFTGATAVEIDGVPVPAFSVRSAGQIVAVTPAGSVGPASVVVEVGAAASAGNTLFTYTAPVLTTTYSGDTTGQPTWNRPDVDFATGAFNGLSSFNPAFQVQQIAVATTGSYTITADWTFDGFLVVYEDAFDPNAQDVNFVIGDDDFNGTLGSQVVATLTAGTPYLIVATAFASASGTYDMTIDGPATVTLVGPPGGVSPQPTITAINPTTGSTLGSTSVTITGTGFLGATAVTFDGATATFTVTNDTTIAATTPAGAAGPADVVVTTPGGTATGAGIFTYATPTPTVTAVVPNNGPTTGGTAVTITGTAFTGATAVTIGGTAVAAFTVSNDTTITTTTPSRGAPSTVDIAVTAPAGTGTGVGLFTYVTPPAIPPTVTAVNPTSGPTAGLTPVTITGTDFTGATAVTIGGAAATSVVVVSGTSITAVTPARNAGPADITVTTPAGSGTGTGLYTYVAAPTVTAVNPTSGPSTGQNTVVITGTNFTGATAVFFGVNAAVTFTVNSPTQITATAPAGTAGATVSVEVTTPGGTNAANGLYSYVAPPAPVVTTYSGTTAGAATWTRPVENNSALSAVGVGVRFEARQIGVTVSGSYTVDAAWTGFDGFLFVYEVPFDPAATAPQATFVAGDDDATSFADSQVVVSLTAGTGYVIVATGFDPVDFGDYDVTISGPAAVVVAPPTLGTSYSDDTTGLPAWNRPDVDATGALIGLSAVGTAVPFHVQEIDVAQTGNYTIHADWTDGQDGYLLVYEGTFDPADPLAAFLTGNDDGATIADSEVVAGLTAGTAYFIVATGFGNTDIGTFDIDISGPAAVTLVPKAPAVTAVTPPVGLIAGGTFVTVVGAGFTGATAVRFDGIAATNLVILNDRKLTCNTPAGTAGPASVEVTAPAGTSAPNALFTYVLATTGPLVASMSPSSGTEQGGTNVTLTGINFSGASVVRFGTALATNLVVVSDTSITCVTPAGTGTVGVEVTTPFGVSPAGPTFIYTGPTSVNRSGGSSGGGGCQAGGAGSGSSAPLWGMLAIAAWLLRRRLGRVA